MFKFLFSTLLFLLGLVFAASLAVAIVLLMAVWSLRAGWARLTGQPVTPWVMRFNPRAGFERFRSAGRPAQPTAAEVVNARAFGESVRSPLIAGGAAQDVTDVRSKPIGRTE